MVIVFDLDDTLYEEMTYARSGFNAVASYLEKQTGQKKEVVLKRLLAIEKKLGRGKVFDTFLDEENRYSKSIVKACIHVYRNHEPVIKVDKEAMACLKRFAAIPKYMVTDGHKIVQAKKVQALNIGSYFKKVFITHRYGVKHAKPSPYCFNRIAQLEKEKKQHIIYIADNPRKDFVGIKKEGFKTIRLMKGNYSHISLPGEFEAHIQIHSLNELTFPFLAKKFSLHE